MMLTSQIWMRLLWADDDEEPDAEGEGPPIVLSAEQPAVEGEITLRLNDRVRPAFEPGSGRESWGSDDRISLAIELRGTLAGEPVLFMAAPIADLHAVYVDIGDDPRPEIAGWWRWRTVTTTAHQVGWFDVDCPTGRDCAQRFRYRFELVDHEGRDAIELDEWSVTADVHRGVPHGDQMFEGGEMDLEVSDPTPVEPLVRPVDVWEFPRDGTSVGRDGSLPLVLTYPPEATDAVVRFTSARTLSAPRGVPLGFVPDESAGRGPDGRELADPRRTVGFTEIPLELGSCIPDDVCTLAGEILGVPSQASRGTVTLIADVRESPDPFAPPSDAPVVFELG